MGVEYCHYLIPRPNNFVPTAEQLSDLAIAFATDDWIACPGSDAIRKTASIDSMAYADAESTYAKVKRQRGFEAVPFPLTADWFKKQSASDLHLTFPVEHGDQVGLHFPLIADGGIPADPYYGIQLHLSSSDFIHHSSEVIEPIDATCNCGEKLEYDLEDEVFYSARIRERCYRCGQIFDPATMDVTVRDGWNGSKSIVRGGAIYRFAVVIDCGKCIPPRKSRLIRANPNLLSLCEHQLGTAFYEVGDVY